MPLDLWCSGNQFAMVIVGVGTLVIHQFNFVLPGPNLRLRDETK